MHFTPENTPARRVMANIVALPPTLGTVPQWRARPFDKAPGDLAQDVIDAALILFAIITDPPLVK